MEPQKNPNFEQNQEQTQHPNYGQNYNSSVESILTAPTAASVRPSFETIYMELAHKLAERSTCLRLHVGTVITSTDFRKVLAVGYNGNASGLANRCDGPEPGNCGCLHSEENAVINCDAPRTLEKMVFVTHLPCKMCAKRLINLGSVRKVFYAQEYRLKDSLRLLMEAGIEVRHFPNSSAFLASQAFPASSASSSASSSSASSSSAAASPFSAPLSSALLTSASLTSASLTSSSLTSSSTESAISTDNSETILPKP